LKANQNKPVVLPLWNLVVYQIKDTIFWKQITTSVLSPLQISCCLSDQRYNFLKANHNKPFVLPLWNLVVYQIKDTIFWKQITTLPNVDVRLTTLFIRSKIQFFESKSQHCGVILMKKIRCLSDQRYNFLKANHNSIWYFIRRFMVVYQIKDTIFWKQITTTALTVIVPVPLFIRSKIQFFESKSQRFSSSCFSFSVVYQIKDTIFWKQITTGFQPLYCDLQLFIRSKIQFFESKSQHDAGSGSVPGSCLSDQRYNFLKANHNLVFCICFSC